MKEFLLFLDSLNIDFKIVLQGSSVLKEAKLLNRETHDLDLIFVDDKINSSLWDKKWEAFTKQINIKKILMSNPVFKKIIVEYNSKEFIVEIILVKNLYENLYTKFLNKNIYKVIVEYAIVAKIFQISFLLSREYFDRKTFKFEKINQTLEDLNLIFQNEEIINSLRTKINKITIQVMYLSLYFWFFYRNNNSFLFNKTQEWKLESIRIWTASNFLKDKLNDLQNFLDKKVLEFSWNVNDIFLKNKVKILDILFGKKTKEELFLTKENKIKFICDVNFNVEENKFYGNEIQVKDLNNVFLFVLFFINEFFQQKINIEKEIIIKIIEDESWNEESLLISKKCLFKEKLQNAFISFREVDLIQENNVIILPVSSKQEILLNNLALLVTSLINIL